MFEGHGVFLTVLGAAGLVSLQCLGKIMSQYIFVVGNRILIFCSVLLLVNFPSARCREALLLNICFAPIALFICVHWLRGAQQKVALVLIVMAFCATSGWNDLLLQLHLYDTHWLSNFSSYLIEWR